jgi:glycosyltransferase involved in cell wall biosynthesis
MSNVGAWLEKLGETVAYAGHGHEGTPGAEGDDRRIWPWAKRSTEFLEAALERERPDVAVLFGDPWDYPGLGELRAKLEQAGRCPRLVAWWTIDSGPLPLELARQGIFDAPHQLCATTQFGCEVLAGDDGAVRLGYRAAHLPLGVDRTIYHPGTAAQRAAARAHWPADALVLGWVGHNQARKHPGTALELVRHFRQRNCRTVLVMKTALSGQLHLGAVCRQMGLKLGESPQESPRADVYVLDEEYTEPQMAALYRGCDVLLSTATAGAPELPLLEARACGTPSVGLDCGSMREVCDGVATPLAGAWEWVDPGVRHAVADLETLAEAALAVGREGLQRSPWVRDWDEVAQDLRGIVAAPQADWVPGAMVG